MSGHRPMRDADLLVVAFVCAVLSLWSNRWSGFDVWLSTQFYAPASGGFVLARDGFWSVLLHDGMKWLSVAAWLGLFAAWAGLRMFRPAATVLCIRIAFVLRIALAVVLAVNLLRAQSAHSCPWSLTAFGGDAQFFRLFDSPSAVPGAGRCLPSGHAASALMWLAALPVLSGHRRTWALLGVLALGVLAGAVQVVRGAHFVSHVLLTVSLCAALVWLAAQMPVRGA